MDMTFVPGTLLTNPAAWTKKIKQKLDNNPV